MCCPGLAEAAAAEAEDDDDAKPKAAKRSANAATGDDKHNDKHKDDKTDAKTDAKKGSKADDDKTDEKKVCDVVIAACACALYVIESFDQCVRVYRPSQSRRRVQTLPMTTTRARRRANAPRRTRCVWCCACLCVFGCVGNVSNRHVCVCVRACVMSLC
jgi:hypothetical protein